ncbi:MAG: CvpA family protein [Desulfobacteraceae bacterium]
MNFFDIAIIIIVAVCLIRGFFRGLIREASGIIGVIAGFYGAYTYYPVLLPYFENWFSKVFYAQILAVFLLFCVIFVAVTMTAVLIRKFLRIVFLGWVDRLFGGAFGTLKGVLIVSVVFIVLTTFVPADLKFVKESRLSPYVGRVAGVMTVFVSNRLQDDFSAKLDWLNTIWKK